MQFVKKEPKIFIISGKAKSGKNEISKIIEKYYSNKKCITISFGHYIKDYAKRVSDWDGNEDTKPRELLQQLGIELIKNKVNNKLFINRILEDIEIFSYFYDIIIISDARLIDEIESLKENYPNSTSIRVIRNNYDNKLTTEEKNHLTEIALDKYTDFDYFVENDANLEDKIIKILSEV
ncbi:MAG: hypothetical protein E7174_01700 [Firmicutes bacterium]|nr:hypothetical protein [Bacillota bacterium]